MIQVKSDNGKGVYCVPAGFIKFVVLHSFVIMIFAFANNVQIVFYLYSRRLERKKIF